MSNVLAAKERSEFKNSTLRALRERGEIPAVVYGNQNGTQSITVNNGELIRTIKEVGRNGIISLDVNGSAKNVMLTDYQVDPLKRDIYHVDFLVVNMDTELQAQVRINLVGDSKGVKDGGVIQQSLHEVTVSAKPNDIPEVIDVDITELQVGDTLYVSDLKLSGSITVEHEGEEVVASVLAPRVEEEISTGEQQDGGIPENVEGRETEAPEE
ncbi:50S ribosomal protein L25/general stress protein Ctc [Bacillus massiliglaciei]|uniref:50S ribosomal protein L25/general stress protein Ctc n=1 Tax=Bacillus massiliglaciei TaxID=1816693 RepID=UPI000B145BEC|nr:50S ribosomal protein L25/general stress protein Ctc [Bacillus massiliglaciei]